MGNLSTDYKILNETEYAEYTLSGNKVYIYVLLLQLDDNKPLKPFYIGQTKNLKQRFNSHHQIRWYNAKFERIVKIRIAGVVPEIKANMAEKELIEMFIHSGYKLTNSAHNKTDEIWSADETVNYYRKHQRVRWNTPLKTWKQKWELSSGDFSLPLKIIQITATVIMSVVERKLSDAQQNGMKPLKLVKVHKPNKNNKAGEVNKNNKETKNAKTYFKAKETKKDKTNKSNFEDKEAKKFNFPTISKPTFKPESKAKQNPFDL